MFASPVRILPVSYCKCQITLITRREFLLIVLQGVKNSNEPTVDDWILIEADLPGPHARRERADGREVQFLVELHRRAILRRNRQCQLPEFHRSQRLG